MTPPAENLQRRLKWIAAGLSLFSGGLAILTLLAWVFDLDIFTNLVPGVERAHPQTAITQIMGATSLWLFLRSDSGAGRKISLVLAALLSLSGLIGIGEGVFGLRLGVNQLVYEMAVPGAGAGRGMAPTTAIGFVFLGIALILVNVRARQNESSRPWLCFPPLLLSLMALLGYVYGVRGFYQVGFYTSMALPSALGVFGLSIATLCARPDRKPAVYFAIDSVGGYVGRRLILVALLVPPALTGLRLMGEWAEFYDSDFGAALLALSTMVVLTAVVLFIADRLGGVEERLRQQTEVTRTIIDAAPAALFLMDPQNRVAFANHEVEPMFGWTESEITGLPLHETLHHHRVDGRVYPAGECPLVRAARKGEVLRDHEDVFFSKDGRAIDVLCASMPLLTEKGNGGSVVVVQDITQRKEAEERLRRSEAKFRAMFEQSAAGVALADGEANLTAVNPKFCELLGYSEEELLQKSAFEITHPDDRERSRESVGRVLRGEISEFSIEKRYLHKDGHEVWVETVGALVPSEAGISSSWLAVVLDITERRRATDALHLAVRRFETLANMIPQFVWSTTADGEPDYFNDRWYEYTGMVRGGGAESKWMDFLHLDDAEATRAKWHESVATGEPYETRYRLRRASDRSYRWFIARALPIQDREGKITRWFGTSTDIEDQRREEEKLEGQVAARTAVAEERGDQVRQLAMELTEAEQRERARLARVLHDDLQQLLVAAKMKVPLIRHGDGSKGDTSAIERLLSQAIEASRSLSKELAPPVLYDHGLGPALCWLGQSSQERYGLKVDVQVSESGEAEDSWLRVFLFEMVRELLLNVAKHADSDRVRVSLTRAEGEVHILVEDFGRGFDVSSARRAGADGGSGLFFVEHRTTLIGGAMRIDSAPGKGTRIHITVPLKEVLQQRVG